MNTVYDLRYAETVCQVGRGNIIDIPMLPEVSELVRPLGQAATDTVCLTPPSAYVVDPLTEAVVPGSVYRSTRDMRSFNIAIGEGSLGTGGEYTLDTITVKGGDLTHMQSILDSLPQSHQLREAIVWRLRNGEIPGSANLKDSVHQAEAAQKIHQSALQRLGRLTYAAVPVAVHCISAVGEENRNTITLRQFLDSNDYLSLSPGERQRARIPSGSGIGRWLLETQGLVPSVYTYATNGPNIRVDVLVNGRHRSATPAVISPLKPELFQNLGGEVRPQPWILGKILHTAYGSLGRTFGFETAGLMPPADDITGDVYHTLLDELPRECDAGDIPDAVMPIFIDRLTEVLALTHSQGATLSKNAYTSNISGSMAPRNVTIGGVVLDLNDYGRCEQVPAAHRDTALETGIRQDCAEMLDTIALLQRMISARHPEGIIADARELYMDKLKEFDTDPSLRARLKDAIYTPDAVPYRIGWHQAVDWAAAC